MVVVFVIFTWEMAAPHGGINPWIILHRAVASASSRAAAHCCIHWSVFSYATGDTRGDDKLNYFTRVTWSRPTHKAFVAADRRPYERGETCVQGQSIASPPSAFAGLGTLLQWRGSSRRPLVPRRAVQLSSREKPTRGDDNFTSVITVVLITESYAPGRWPRHAPNPAD